MNPSSLALQYNYSAIITSTQVASQLGVSLRADLGPQREPGDTSPESKGVFVTLQYILWGDLE